MELRRKLVQVDERGDGTASLMHRGVTLPFGKVDKDLSVRLFTSVDDLGSGEPVPPGG